MEKLLSIGKILNFHGIQGEVKVGYTTDKKDQLINIKEFYIVKGSEIIPVTIESVRFHKNFALVKFKEFSSVNEAAELKGAFLKVPKALIQGYLETDEFYIDDLINMDAFDTEGNYAGKITNVISSGQESLLAVRNQENKEYLVPFVKELVPDVNIKDKKVIIKKIPGLLEEIN